MGVKKEVNLVSSADDVCETKFDLVIALPNSTGIQCNLASEFQN